MSTKEKLLRRFYSLPNDFTFDEVIRLFSLYGFTLYNKGGTSGSRVAFVKDKEIFTMHRPHPDSIVRRGTLKGIMDFLENKSMNE